MANKDFGRLNYIASFRKKKAIDSERKEVIRRTARSREKNTRHTM